ncbi:universal stress protein [Vagococcus acidifermentans]|uniref:Universal stress protein n=1 Tax=Vagococcus acidifermentans TaxID=564710 RepID=A0A430AN34_9ENTE|nr:universal stress protein [Vagococcus acidifermentans]RSU09499.1 hypothetical protein CBF27_12370 [Vagococcus acidifermentans]
MEEAYKNVLAAFDGSAQSENALKRAMFISKRNNAELTVVQVFDTFDFVSSDSAVFNAVYEQHKSNEQSAREELESKIENLNFALSKPVQIITPHGNAKREIVKLAKEKDVDLIVIGATGRHNVEQFFVGSTASYVLTHAHCTVLVVK